MYTIIQDSRPYYIIYTFPGLEELIDLCRYYPLPGGRVDYSGFLHQRMGPQWSDRVLSMVPASQQMPLNRERVSLFVSEPGFYYGPHKDGTNHRFSLNFAIQVKDSQCVTSWYSDQDLADYSVTSEYLPWTQRRLSNRSREIEGWCPGDRVPLHSMCLQQGQAILFNTELFHDFDNRTSSHRRVILTLRHQTPALVYFEDAARIMFGLT
jgi:hypothetical protein